jgi:hypothetical protein
MLPDGFRRCVLSAFNRVLVQVRHSVTQRVYGMVAAGEVAAPVNQFSTA